MGAFIDNPPEIRGIVTEIKTREGKYKDLYLTVKYGLKKKAEYIIHNDQRFNVEHIKEQIDNKLDSEDLMINEYSERKYLYITIGDKTMQVTGKRIFSNSYF